MSRARSTSSPCEPELSSSTSAIARRCSSVAWAAIRARASASSIPRLISRSTRGLLVGVDDHHEREHRRHPGLDEQRDVLDDHRIVGHRGDDLLAPLPTSGCTMPFSVGALLVVDERLGRQRGPVQRAVGQQDVLAERVDQLGQPLGARFDDLPGDDVAVDDDAAAAH